MTARGPRLPFEFHFWRRVQRTTDSLACWPWIGARSHGYGRARGLDGRRQPAHRIAWSLANGQPVPAGMFVLHHCDNKPCCNPSHLHVGTHADNTREAIERGRFLSGERHAESRYSDAQRMLAKELRGQGSSYRAIAAELGLRNKWTARDLVWGRGRAVR